MNDLLSKLRISEFRQLLRLYNSAGIDLYNAIDGGAGSGQTSMIIADYLQSDSVVYAFEPFPGNHRFFEGKDPRIKLMKYALAHGNGVANFCVPSVVSSNSLWGERGLEGYSSIGHFTNLSPDDDRNVIQVQCVKADDVIPETAKVGFIKLDLQGAELSALQGMDRILSDAFFLWVEFAGQAGLLDFFTKRDYAVFDTEYLFSNPRPAEAINKFEVSKDNYELSTGASAWFGFKREPWTCFNTEFLQFQRSYSMMQTDLVCVHRSKLTFFLNALSRI